MPRWVYWRECASASGEEVPDAPEKDRRTDDGKATGCHGGDGKCRNVETVRGPDDQKRHVARDSARKQQDKEGRSRSKEDLSHEGDGHRLTPALQPRRLTITHGADGCKRCWAARCLPYARVRARPQEPLLPLLGSLLGLLKPRCDAFACNSQYLLHILKPRLRQIVEVHEPVRQTESPERTNRHLGLPITRGILNREPHLLESDVPMLVLA